MLTDDGFLCNDVFKAVQEVAIHLRYCKDILDIRTLSKQCGYDIDALIITLCQLLP